MLYLTFKPERFANEAALSRQLYYDYERNFIRNVFLDGFCTWKHCLHESTQLGAGFAYFFCDSLYSLEYYSKSQDISASAHELITLTYFLDAVSVLTDGEDEFHDFVVSFGSLIRDYFEKNDATIMNSVFLLREKWIRPMKTSRILRAWIESVKESGGVTDFIKLPQEWQLEIALGQAYLSDTDGIVAADDTSSVANLSDVFAVKEGERFGAIDMSFLYPMTDSYAAEKLKASHNFRRSEGNWNFSDSVSA